MHKFLFVAAENDGIARCKAGGMGDVVRDVPRQISNQGDEVSVVTPAYSFLHKNAEFKTNLNFSLQGIPYEAGLYRVTPKKQFPNLYHYVVHHPEITSGDIAHMYHNDVKEPFYTDAIKFFIFSTAVAQAIKQKAFGDIETVHLHDWHTSMLLFLKEYDPAYSYLKKLWFVYTIHNLAIQGIRPFQNNYSSVENWFPNVPYLEEALRDLRYPDCINLMAVGIRLSDALHTVSPSYKDDVLLPSHPPEFIGGEGLELDLQKANRDKKFFGILNGCNYENIRKAETGKLFPNIITAIFKWLQEESKKYKADFLAHTGEKIIPLLDKKPKFICSSVARLTEQKFYFFKKSPEALVQILKMLKKINGIYILLGTGAPEYEELMRKMSKEHDNFIFINAQSEDVIDSLYLESNLYFMPSLFEPCGISQMLAMRNGTPCLVHYTGGLKDTIIPMKTGFAFEGEHYDETVKNMVLEFKNVLDTFRNDQDKWEEIKNAAMEMKFTWKASVVDYYKRLYKIEEQS